MKTEIVILGCGLSGMLTALSFAKMNIASTIIEYQSINDNRFFSDIRTTALTPVSAQCLRNINLWCDIEKIASAMLDVYVVDNKAPEMLHFSNIASGDILGYIVKNGQFKEILLSHVKNHPLITIIDQCDYQKVESYSDYSIIYLSNNEIIICNLLIICDGYNSKVRQYYFSNKIEKFYSQTALTFNIRHERNHENCAVEHFMPSGPFAILPLQDQKSSAIVWTTQKMQAPLLTNLPTEEFEYLVQRNCGTALGNINLDSHISAFPLQARLTNKYFYNKIIVIADSAHIIHPLAGQGLNQGIKDIKTLVRLVSNIGINKEMLIEYQKLRQSDNFAMYMITEGLNIIFSNHSKYLWYLRRIGIKTIDSLNPIKKLLIQYAMGQR